VQIYWQLGDGRFDLQGEMISGTNRQDIMSHSYSQHGTFGILKNGALLSIQVLGSLATPSNAAFQCIPHKSRRLSYVNREARQAFPTCLGVPKYQFVPQPHFLFRLDLNNHL